MSTVAKHRHNRLIRLLRALLRRPGHSLLLRLGLLLAGLSLLGALIQSVVVDSFAREQIETQIGSNLASLGSHTADLLDRSMFERLQDMQMLGELDMFHTPNVDPARQRALLTRVQRSNPDYGWIGFANTKGRVLASTAAPLEGTSIANAAWFQHGLQQPFIGTVHGAPATTATTPARVIDIATPVYDSNGMIQGVLGAQLLWQWRFAIGAALQPAAQSPVNIVITDATGQVLLGPDPLIDHRLPFAPTLATEPSAPHLLTWPDGAEYLTVGQRTNGYHTYAGSGWIVLVRQPAAAAFVPVRALSYRIFAGTLGCALIFAALASVIVRRMLQPMRAIAHVAEQIRAGQRAVAWPHTNGHDEVAQLSSALHMLITTLLTHEDALRSQTTRLATELQARTTAEAEAHRQAQHAAILVRIAGRLNAQHDMHAVLQAVCEETQRAFQVPTVLIRLFHPTLQVFQLGTAIGVPDSYFAQAVDEPSAFFLEALARAEDGQFITIMPDTAALANTPYTHAATMWRGRSLCLIAMQRDGELLGTISLIGADTNVPLTPGTRDLLIGIANQAAQAVANVRVYTQATHRLAQLQSLHAIDQAILHERTLPGVLAVAAEQTKARLHADAVNIIHFYAERNALTVAASTGFRRGVLLPATAPRGGYAEQVIHSRRMVSSATATATPLSPAFAKWLDSEGMLSYHGVPLIANNMVHGVLEVFHRQPTAPDEEWITFLKVLAGQIAIAMEHSLLFQGLANANTALMRAYDTTILGWSRALDLRDKETEGHSQRVTTLTLELARAVGMEDDALVHVQRGALLHDIGKMGVPDRVLLKPGPLDPDEWSVMQRHPSYAFDLLAPISHLQPALDIPYCHHERWNGTGYPRGLAGEQIPLAARIFAVVDVWDALTHDRPYRTAWPNEQALEHIASLAGQHFDPLVTATFLALIAHHTAFQHDVVGDV